MHESVHHLYSHYIQLLQIKENKSNNSKKKFNCATLI